MLTTVHEFHTTHNHLNDGSIDDEGAWGSFHGESRRELPAGAVAILKAWLLSPEHFTHPYPTPQDQVMLMQKTGIDERQLKNWFTNARRRIWKPLLRRQLLEQGNLHLAGNPTGAHNGAAVPGVVPGLMVPGLSRRDDGVVYQQAKAVQHTQSPEVQQPHQQVQVVDQYGNHNIIYAQQPQVAHTAPIMAHQQQYYDPNAQLANLPQGRVMHAAASIGSLPPMNPSGSTQQLSKSDSHAVLMELFAQDQVLVRQATEAAGQKKADHDRGPYYYCSLLAIDMEDMGSNNKKGSGNNNNKSISKRIFILVILSGIVLFLAWCLITRLFTDWRLQDASLGREYLMSHVLEPHYNKQAYHLPHEVRG